MENAQGIQVTFLDQTGAKSVKAKISPTVKVKQIIPTIITKMTLPATAPDGTPMSYSLDWKEAGKRLQEEKSLTEEGVLNLEKMLAIENLYEPGNMAILHHVNQALRAHAIFKRDVDYVVKDGEVIIVDEFTGRLMPGRRWGDGQHQAIEAKEGLTIARENQTLATITFQNYFRMYEKLAGMTGTADTEAAEFNEIYKLDVVEIPTQNDWLLHREAQQHLQRVERILECILDTH